METVNRVLATTHEVSLKGGNRRWFERKLTESVRRALSDLPVERVQRPSWRVLVTFSEPVPFREAARRLGTVFGLHAIMPVMHAGFRLEEVAAVLDRVLAEREATTFAIRCTRSDKRYPMTSMEIEREIGAHVVERTGWKVDLGRPELTFHLLVDGNGIWIWDRRVPGPGGLPAGTGGRAACMLSGGIDSPVAAWLAAKRGMRLDFVHFHSVPRTDPASLAKTEDLVRVLVRYQGPARLALVPLLDIQEQVVARCPAEYRVLLYRRFMLRLARRLAHRMKCKALITGESLGQVSSQTLENIAAVEEVVDLPVLRPCIGMDKQEIIAVARRVGTFDISIRPHVDCCSFHVPDHPATRARARDLAAAEEVLDVPALVDDALSRTELVRVDEPVEWQEVPCPAGADDG
jgi:thiamine biosynthesis protein ThiI